MRRYKILIVCCFLCVFIGFTRVDAKKNELPLKGKTIYLDAGHGGADPGALYQGIEEKHINLKITLKLKKSMEEKGARIYLTRDADYDLSKPNAYQRKRSDLGERARLINVSDCDLYLSVHLNASVHTNWHGGQMFYDDVNEENEKLATILQEQFQNDLNSTRKQKRITDLYMYRKAKKPGVLAEVGFLSNPNERYLLQQDSYQQKIVDTLIRGVLRYFESQ